MCSNNRAACLIALGESTTLPITHLARLAHMSISLSRPKKSKRPFTSDSNAMSLEDETQQPMISGSSQAAPALSSAAVLNKMQAQYATATSVASFATTGNLPLPPSDPPVAVDSSELTQESEDSLRWESMKQAQELPPPTSEPLPLIEEEPQPQPKASAMSSELTEFIVSQTPEFANDSMKVVTDSEEGEMTDIEDEGDEGDSVSTPPNDTPPNSNPQVDAAISAPLHRGSPSPDSSLRPISRSVPILPPTSPTKELFSPLRHAARITPSKKLPTSPHSPFKVAPPPPLSFGKSPRVAMPSTVAKSPFGVQSTSHSKPSSPSKSSPSKVLSIVPRTSQSPSAGRTRSARLPSLGGSSDFGNDMVHKPKPAPLDVFNRTMELASPERPSSSSHSSRASPKMGSTWKTSKSSPPQTPSSMSPKAFPGFEPTLLNEIDELDDETAPAVDAETAASKTSPREYYSSSTQVDPVTSGPQTSPTRRAPTSPPANASQTQLNTVRRLGSQTQLNSGNAPPSSPPASPSRRFGSLSSAAGLSSPNLLAGESIGPIDMGDCNSQDLPFQATQLNTIPDSLSSPVKRPAPRPSSPPREADERDDEAPIVTRPPRGGNRGAIPPSPPPHPELEATYVDCASLSTNEPFDSQKAAQAAQSQPAQGGILQSSPEPSRLPHRTVTSALPVSTPLSPPPSNEEMNGLQPSPATPSRSRDIHYADSSESLVPVKRPRQSPRKYGNRRRQTLLPTTRAAMPLAKVATSPTKPSSKSTRPSRRRVPTPSDDEAADDECEPAWDEHAREESAGIESVRDEPPSSQPRRSTSRSASHRSASSSSVADDPADATFHDVSQVVASQFSTEGESSPPSHDTGPSIAAKGKKRASSKPKAPTGQRTSPRSKPSSEERASSRESSRPSRNKRKPKSSQAAELSDDSSSAPEDAEDHSYRPTEQGQAKAKAAAAKAKPAKALKERPNEEQSKSKRKASGTYKPPPSKRAKASAASATSKLSRSSGPARVATPGPSHSTSTSSRVRAASAATDTTVPSPLRVLGLWKLGDVYYAGTVVGRNSQGFNIQFDDGLTRCMGTERLRQLHLRFAETVYSRGDLDAYQVAELYNGVGDVKVVDGRGKGAVIESNRLVVFPTDIAQNFSDRHVSMEELDKQFPLSARLSLPSTNGAFDGKVFLMTGDEGKDALQRAVERNGGSVVGDWAGLFNITADGHTLVVRGAPFLLLCTSKRIMSPKVMSALAAGIPVLAPRYVEDAVKGTVDWRSYLISPGISALLREPASQVVDPNWGGESWDATGAKAVREPLAGTTVLWVPTTARYKLRDEINVSALNAACSQLLIVSLWCRSASGQWGRS